MLKKEQFIETNNIEKITLSDEIARKFNLTSAIFLNVNGLLDKYIFILGRKLESFSFGIYLPDRNINKIAIDYGDDCYKISFFRQNELIQKTMLPIESFIFSYVLDRPDKKKELEK